MFVFACFQMVQAQTVQIAGNVTGVDDGSPLPGVSVVVKGTTIGTATDAEGHYELSVPEDATTLVFSFVGMASQEVEIGGRTMINVALSSEAFNLNEIIVVAYGQQSREAKTGAVGVVKSDELQDIAETSIDKMLDGKVAGVVISSTTGQPGGSNQVRIRGTSSILAGSQPLYIVDGVPVMQGDQTYFQNTGNALASLNPNDIEDITILKDASAASIYGSRAANGVVVITTKSGKSTASGKSVVNFRTSYGQEMLANDNGYGIMKFDDWVDFSRDAVINAGLDPDDASPGNAGYYYPKSLKDSTHTDWLDQLTRKGNIYNAELSVQGNNDRTSHYFSAAYQKHEGAFYGVDFEKYQGRLNLEHQVNDWLKVGTRINAAFTDQNDVAMQSLYFVNPLFGGILISPLDPVFNDDGTPNLNIPSNSNTNPYATALYDDQWEKQNRLSANAYLEVKLPIEGLKFRTTDNYEFTGGEGRRYWSPQANGGTTGTLQVSRSKYSQMTTSNVLTFDKIFGSHSLNLVAGQEAVKYYNNSYYIYSPDVDPDIPFPTTSTSAADQTDYSESAYTLASYFGRLDYNFASRYYLMASLRTDGSSRFGADTRWGTFYSVAASWNLHNESFLQNLSMINQLKLRGSYGISGNFNIGNYEQFGLYSSEQYNSVTGLAPTQPANPDLGWENNAELNGGLDFTVYDRVSGTLEIYQRKTTNMLLNYPLSRTSGFSSIRQNIGELQNNGFEAMVDVQVVKGSAFNWSVGFNVAHNKSEILDLGKDEQFINPNNSRIVHKVGESLYSFYLYDYAGVNPANGDALWYNEAGDLTNKYADANRIIAGSPEPKYVGGFNTAIGFKGIYLSANFAFKTGHQVLIEENRYINGDGYLWGIGQANTATDYWKKPGDITRNPKPIANNNTSSNGYRSKRWMYDGDYLRVKDVTLSYSLPSSLISRIGVERFRIYVSATNAYTFHDVPFFDPERGVEGTGFGIYPQTKKASVGLDVSF